MTCGLPLLRSGGRSRGRWTAWRPRRSVRKNFLRRLTEGRGISGYVSVDPEQLQRILDNLFDGFYRGDGSRNKKEGNGLGLYIVRYLTEVMGGSVRAESAGRLAVYLEFGSLRFLAMNPNIVFSKEQLFEKIWGYDHVGDNATVMVHINRIREKIEDDSRNPKILETVWGAGYRFNK